MADPDYLTKAAIKKERGWTEGAITKFLGDPDKLGSNPYSSKTPSHLYLLSRVKKAERTKKFKEWKAKSETRRSAARKAANTRKEKTLRKVRSRLGEIQLCPAAQGLSKKRLRKLAVASYEDIEMERCSYGIPRTVDKDAPASFIHRIEVNFLRHEATLYDEELEEYAGSTGVRDAVDMVRERVYEVIADEYPHLKKECERQLEERRATEEWIKEQRMNG